MKATPERKPPSKSALSAQARREQKLANAEAALASIRLRLRERLKSRLASHDYWPERTPAVRAHQQSIGHAIARIIARRHSEYGADKLAYQELDHACGRRVKRESQMGEVATRRFRHYLAFIVATEARGRWRERKETPTPVNLGFAGCRPFYADEGMRAYNPVREYQEAAIEVEYWREMVRLGAVQIGLTLEDEEAA